MKNICWLIKIFSFSVLRSKLWGPCWLVLFRDINLFSHLLMLIGTVRTPVPAVFLHVTHVLRGSLRLSCRRELHVSLPPREQRGKPLGMPCAPDRRKAATYSSPGDQQERSLGDSLLGVQLQQCLSGVPSVLLSLLNSLLYLEAERHVLVRSCLFLILLFLLISQLFGRTVE